MQQVTAIIFEEHKKYSIENPLLKQKILSLEELNKLYIKTDSLQQKEIELYKNQVITKDEKINKLKSSQKKIITGSSVGGIVLLILIFIL